MLTSYHTHTPRCRHASGSERAYIEQAIAEGMAVLGFADHAPYPFFPGYYSDFRMYTEQAEDYVRTLRTLREEYRGKIEIKIGLEAEYYPQLFDRFLTFIAPLDLDYIILGQHFLDNEYDTHRYSGLLTREEGYMAAYTDQVIAGLRTGVFTYVAHPDLANYDGDPAIYRRHSLRLCQAAKEAGVPLEINLLGIRDHRHYPHRSFFETAAQVGNDIILGSDAHSPDVVADLPSRRIAGQMVEELGLHCIERPELRRPIKG